MTMTSVFAPIFKSEEQGDGTIIVYGKATDDALDRDQQRCDADWLNKAMPEWYKTGANVREMHDSKRAVGVGIGHDISADGHYVRAHIVDPVSVLKIKHGVLKGFSIGISSPVISKSKDAPAGRITSGDICELSICDRPSNPGCLLQLAKSAKPGMEIDAADFDEERGLVRCQELIEKADPVATAPTGEQVKAAEFMEPTERLKTDEPTETETEPVFDKTAALALVRSILRKADAPMKDLGVEVPPVEESPERSDIDGAKAAIAIIAELIKSEAEGMVFCPNEDIDIRCLLEAVAALRVFISREHGEPINGTGDDDSDNVLVLADAPDLVKAKYNADELRAMLKQGHAIENANGDPSYPIGDREDLRKAIHAVGRGSGDHDRIRAHIERRAKALGAADMIPENWSSGGANKAAADVEVTAVDTETTETTESTETVKSTEPEVTKAAVIDSDGIEKALAAVLEKTDSPLHKALTAIVEASARSTVDQLGELGSRLEKVEQMAVPGGPTLRRTEVERTEARKADLFRTMKHYQSLADNMQDRVLREGYRTKAKAVEVELKALA